VACQQSEPVGYPVFQEDSGETTGDSACSWHPRTINLHDIGQISFTYKNCNKSMIRDTSYYEDGNWVRFKYYEFEERDYYPVIGVFPLKGRDAETVLREEIFAKELKNPLCELGKKLQETLDGHGQDPFPVSYPSRWQLTSYDEAEDNPELLDIVYPYDACGPFAQNDVMYWGDQIGSYISEKYGHIFIMRTKYVSYEIDYYTVRFNPAE